jgi:CTP:phosphocholine cytidylyltransferase involved in choline phosphorylation for cell surface LPS epitopes
MNKRDWIVLAVLVKYGYTNQRSLVQYTGYSLGLVNSSLKKLEEEGYIDAAHAITAKTEAHIEASKPKRAIILAAGLGLRMTPINKVPKGLLQVNGEPLVEHIIHQLHEVGIREIHIVVGHMMERFDYLVDKFEVELIYDHEFARKDTLHSLSRAVDKLSNCYIVPCSIWFSRNPFNTNEYFSWYAVSEYIDDDSCVRLNRKMELIYTESESGGNSMLGLSYLLESDAAQVRKRLIERNSQRKYSRDIWEMALFDENKMDAYARIMLGQSAYEIKTYEQLRELDSESKNLQSERINYISKKFEISKDEITDISGLFKGMTNRHMRFSVDDKPYLLRVPGEGSNEIISRQQEAAVYAALQGKDLTDRIVHITPEDGFKITEYWESARNCDPANEEDVAACIRHLKKLHDMKLETGHAFDVLERLERYEYLRNAPASFVDYDETRAKVVELLGMIDRLPEERCLCHIDTADVNFLFVDDEVFLIDWEYGGMCDPHIDVSMFCIFAEYSKEQIDKVADIYFDDPASPVSRLKFYIYAAAGGFLWSVWSEYKANMGVDFGDYASKQYRYAKRFYKHAKEIAGELGV